MECARTKYRRTIMATRWADFSQSSRVKFWTNCSLAISSHSTRASGCWTPPTVRVLRQEHVNSRERPSPVCWCNLVQGATASMASTGMVAMRNLQLTEPKESCSGSNPTLSAIPPLVHSHEQIEPISVGGQRLPRWRPVPASRGSVRVTTDEPDKSLRLQEQQCDSACRSARVSQDPILLRE